MFQPKHDNSVIKYMIAVEFSLEFRILNCKAVNCKEKKIKYLKMSNF